MNVSGLAFPKKWITLTNIAQSKLYSQVFNVFQFTKSIGRHIRQFVAVQVPELTKRKKRHKKLKSNSIMFICPFLFFILSAFLDRDEFQHKYGLLIDHKRTPPPRFLIRKRMGMLVENSKRNP